MSHRNEPTTAGDWSALRAALLADAEAWQTLAANADTQPGLPRLLAEDYAIAVRTACHIAARAALTAADQAALFAEDLEQVAS